MQTIENQCKKAYDASHFLASLSSDIKNQALSLMAASILDNKESILLANQTDITQGKQNGLSTALIDRLSLNEERLQGISDSIKTIEALEDPIDDVISDTTLPNGLNLKKIRVPIGVIGMIYEARPNVTADAIALAIKTGNSVVLRGSASAYQSNLAITNTLQAAAKQAGLSPDTIQLLEDTSRASVKIFVSMNQYLSLIIPRGGSHLIQHVVKSATVPTIETGVGNCHVFIDQSADIKKAHDIVVNAKTHRPSVCNACETLLVHQSIAQAALPDLLHTLESKGVELRGCKKTQTLYSNVHLATDEDWDTEYLDLILSIKIVNSLDDAISHIQQHGTLHSEAIVSEDKTAIDTFCKLVDAAAVLVNASTRFVDGGEFGFGAEIGISTQKLHARGPMGLPELTSTKYIVTGNGHIRT